MALGGESPNPEEGGRQGDDWEGGGDNSMRTIALALSVELHICFRLTRRAWHLRINRIFIRLPRRWE